MQRVPPPTPLPDPAFEAALLDCTPGLRRWARILTRNADDAADLLQDTLVRALTYRGRFDGANIGAWTREMMYRIFVAELRKAKFASSVDPLVLLERTPGPCPQDSIVEMRETLAALDQLPSGMSVSMLLSGEGYSLDEIATRTGVAVGTAKSRISRGRAALAELSGR